MKYNVFSGNALPNINHIVKQKNEDARKRKQLPPTGLFGGNCIVFLRSRFCGSVIIGLIRTLRKFRKYFRPASRHGYGSVSHLPCDKPGSADEQGRCGYGLPCRNQPTGPAAQLQAKRNGNLRMGTSSGNSSTGMPARTPVCRAPKPVLHPAGSVRKWEFKFSFLPGEITGHRIKMRKDGEQPSIDPSLRVSPHPHKKKSELRRRNPDCHLDNGGAF